MARKDKMRKDNFYRIKENNDFREKAERIAERIYNPNKHFMNEYLIDLLEIIHEKGKITESELQQELTKRRNTSKLATLQFIYSTAEAVKQWLNFNATGKEKEIIKNSNSASSILKLLVDHIEKI